MHKNNKQIFTFSSSDDDVSKIFSKSFKETARSSSRINLGQKFLVDGGERAFPDVSLGFDEVTSWVGIIGDTSTGDGMLNDMSFSSSYDKKIK